MKRPEIPLNEEARLEALRAYDVLDTRTEESFDQLTKLASMVMGTPIALISLIDSNRQWFKSRVGLEVAETPRDVSFCGHVVAEENPLVVPDAHLDERFADNPLVTGEPNVRFYAGMPLRTPDGFVLGSLCAIDRTPRHPTRAQLQMLSLLADQVVEKLEAGKLRKNVFADHLRAVETQARLEALFDSMAEGVILQDGQGVITDVNAATEKILGLTLAQMRGSTSIDPRWKGVREDGTDFPPRERPAMTALRTGKPCTDVVMGVHHVSGELKWLSVNSMPMISAGQTAPHGVVTTFHDISLIKAAHQAAERLSKQERLVTTGTLAAGVGHEINNPLSFVLSNLELCIEELSLISQNAKLREVMAMLIDAREGAERIRRIVRGLRALASEESAPVAIEVGSAVDISMSMAAHEIRLKATLERALIETPPVLADESRLSQVLVNLLVNAAQAFTTPNIELNRITISSEVAPGNRVAISVADNGPGIPTELLSRIFDPFFTTKPVGQGTGLGLSISQSIVTSLGGELTVDSAVGRGTVFRVVLPMATLPSKAEEVGALATPVADGRLKVMVIDDEPAVLRSLVRVFQRDHQVSSFTDAREALKLLDTGETFDGIFCDLMMPHLSGDAFYEAVRKRHPSQLKRIVFVSGGATLPHVESFLAGIPNPRVEKPFTSQQLKDMLREVSSK